MELLPISMVQMGRNKLRDPRGLLLLLVGPRSFVRLGVGTSTSVWGSLGQSWWFERECSKGLVDLPSLRGSRVGED